MEEQLTVETPGEIVSRLRSRRGLTLHQLGDAAGVPHSYVSAIEHGHRQPGPRVATRLAKALAMKKSERDGFLLAVAQSGKRDRTTPNMRQVPHAVLLTVAECLSREVGGKTIRSCTLVVSGAKHDGRRARDSAPDFIVEFNDRTRLAVEIKTYPV